jgi:hypothetical protein
MVGALRPGRNGAPISRLRPPRISPAGIDAARNGHRPQPGGHSEIDHPGKRLADRVGGGAGNTQLPLSGSLSFGIRLRRRRAHPDLIQWAGFDDSGPAHCIGNGKRTLSQLGVAADVSSVGRFQGRIGYVLGAQYPDETVPQLWLDKETFRPMRWLLKPASAGNLSEAIDVRYYDWRKVSSIWYPERIEFYQGDRLLRRMQVQRTRVNPELSSRLFDVAYLKSIYPSAPAPPPTQGESGGKNEVQRTIDRFRKLFE